MKKKLALLILCLFFVVVTDALSADFLISRPFAYKSQFPQGLEKLGFPEGEFLNVGCFISPADTPIKEVIIKNLNTGVVLIATPAKIGNIFKGLWVVDPMPPFDPSKHMGVWEMRGKDEKGNEDTAETHNLNIEGNMPYLEGVKASGNPVAPTITWSAPKDGEIPQGIEVRYQVRLLMDINKQVYRSSIISGMLTVCPIPEGVINSDDLSKIYVRVQCQGWDKNEGGFLPIELETNTFVPLKEALGKQ